jgi:hypothetical protein
MSGWSFGHKWVCSLGRKAFKFPNDLGLSQSRKVSAY